jgi:hypothetical protein
MSGTNTDSIAVFYRTDKPNNPPPNGVLREGQFCIEMADPMRLWFGCPSTLDSTGRRLLFDASLAAGGPPVIMSATAPGGASAGQLWWDTQGCQLYVFYDDGSSAAWIAASSTGSLSAAVGALAAEVASLRAQVAQLRDR